MNKILMILTSHRLDCFKLCMDLLIQKGSIHFFDRVVLLLNGVKGRHQRHIESLRARHPDIAWDTISGPRGRGRFISQLQNECVRRYPGNLYFKIDEDTFVSSDWAQKLYDVFLTHCHDSNRSLVTPIIPNNGLGFWHLLNMFPELRNEYRNRFSADLTPAFDGPVWINPRIAAWITRKFINLDAANSSLCEKPAPSVSLYGKRFSINCICYDYPHWLEIGGVPEQDEVGWGSWIEANHKAVFVSTRSLVHHYAFFVQQDWLDRSPLLEELRESNLPASNRIERYMIRSGIPRRLRTAYQVMHRIKSFFTVDKP